MKQFLLSAKPGRDGQIRFEGGDYRYLARVRRLAPGEFFPALLPDGAETVVRVLSVDDKTLTGEVFQGGHCPPAPDKPVPPAPVFLFQALPKGDKMDLIVRQAAEGAIAEIVPFTSAFSAVKNKSREQKYSRWQRIIKEARQQCGSVVATEISRPLDIDELFAYWENIKTRRPRVLGLLFHHIPLAHDSLHGYLGNGRPEAVAIAVGPEGGFSPAEAERFIAAGFKPFTVEGTILRTETAALYAQAAVRILLLERDSWETK